MNKKPFALFAALALLSVMALAGCGDPAKDENALSLLVKASDIQKIYIQRVIDRYEAEKGVRIVPVAVEDTAFEAELEKRFKKDDMTDLVLHFNDSSLNRFNVSKSFYYMNDEPWISELTDSARTYCLDSGGNVLGLPFWENSVSGCYYNKKLLDSLGLKAATTQTEFDALCQALKDIGYTPLYWAADGCNWMFQFALDAVFADDPALLEKLNKNEITYADIPAVRDMVEWLDMAARSGWFNVDYAERAWDDISSDMANGSAVCIPVWDTWFTTDFKGGGDYSAEDFALMPVFMGTADKGVYEGGNMNMLMASKNSPKLETALDFIAFCAEPENYNAAFDGVPTVSNFKNQTTNIQSDMVTAAMDSIRSNERVSTAWPKIIGYSQDDTGAAVRQMFQRKTDPAGCLNLMDKYRIAAAKELGAEGF